MPRNNDLIRRGDVLAPVDLLRSQGYICACCCEEFKAMIGKVPSRTNVLSPRSRAVIMAYTGVTMLKGDKLDHFYGYLAELYGHAVYSHEIPYLPDIADRARADFLALCAEVNDDPS